MNRDYRNLNEDMTASDNYTVGGYCALFEPYELMTIDNVTYYEKIHPQALKGADMSDIVFQLDHEGRVYARQSNDTLKVKVDSQGIYAEVDLSSTEASREIYEDIKVGLLNKQSWAFTVEEEYFERETRTRHITKIKKIYDISVTGKPANSATNIEVVNRSQQQYIEALRNKEKADLEERQLLHYQYLIRKNSLENR